ncbi:hypothetical protein D3C87_157890 [compost metagenome]
MLNKSCLHFLVFISFSAFAQIKGTIKDNATKEPIPYVNIWIEGKDNGTTADENGNFILPSVTDISKRILLNSVGYAPVYVKISDVNGTILLTPKPIELNEINITNNKTGKHRIVINPLKKVKKVKSYGLGSGARMVARYIPYKSEYEAMPYINKVRFPVQKYNKSFTFNLRFYSVNEDKRPGEPLYDENILVTIPPDKKEISIDLSMLNIKMPQEGLYVVAERFLIKQNISATTYKKVVDDNGKLIPEEKREYLYDHFGPVFICEQTSTDEGGWNYYNGKWNQGYHFMIVSPPEKTHIHGLFAVEITLTD